MCARCAPGSSFRRNDLTTLIVGGATRLTESGLSITEWKPVTGVLPPLSQGDWQAEFDKYQEIPQYRELNRGMSLEQFKTIYWWEWSHRLLARLVGAVFLLPFFFFLWRGMIPRELRSRLWLIFLGGAALGAVGWWMVSSGLAGSGGSVSQYRLAFHLTLACVDLRGDRVDGAANERAQRAKMSRRGLKLARSSLVALLIVQIYAGALVAGLDAGLSSIPGRLSTARSALGGKALVRDAMVAQSVRKYAHRQFNHRMPAYAIWVLATLARLRRARARRRLAAL